MIDYDNVITVYHCNYEDKLTNFILHNRICISKDKQYLGDGMYFWKSKRDLEFWKIEKIRKRKKNKQHGVVLGVKAKISYNENQILDLTDNEQFKKLEKLKEIFIRADKNEKVQITYNLGEVINRVFNFQDSKVKEFVSAISIVKLGVRYDDINKKKEEIIGYYSGKLSKNQKISVDTRIMYCVKKQDNVQFCDVICKEEES